MNRNGFLELYEYVKHNNSKSYIETYTKEKERGAFAAWLKCNSRVVHIFVNILCVCIITYSVIWIFYCLKFVWSQEFSAERAHTILTSLGGWDGILNLIVL